MANRFEQVDEVVDDAITIVLAQRAGRTMGQGRLPEERPSSPSQPTG